MFSQNQARICLFGQNPAGLALTAEQAVLAKADTRQIAFTVEPCNPEQLLSYDIVATQRNAFLRTKRDDALALIKTIEDDDYRRFAEVTAADLNKAAEAERAQIEKIKANVADGAPDGFGVVLLKTESPNLCLAVGGRVPSHRHLLLRDEDKLNLEMQTKVVIKDTNIDDAFANIQKRQCGAVYASAADLKTLTGALTHDGIPYAFSSLWNLPTDVEREDAELAEKARIAAQEETERAERNADQLRLELKRAEDLIPKASPAELMGDSLGAKFLSSLWVGGIRGMPAAVKLRDDYSAAELRALAKRSKDVNQSRRLLSLAAVRDGMDRSEAAKIGGMDRQTLRDWVHRFNAAGPDGLFDNWTDGPTPRLSREQLDDLAKIVERGPDRKVDGVVRWRRIDLKRVIADRFGVEYHARYVGKLLKKLGFSHMSARPRHPAQDEQIVEAFKKTSRAR